MLPGETIRSGAAGVCCGNKLELRVMCSGAGYYLGTICPGCGPYSRETEYYRSKTEAEEALRTGQIRWRS